jgi:hypothetical protein
MIQLTCSCAGIRLAWYLSVALILTGSASGAQMSDRAQPPPIVKSKGHFSARRLSAPPVIDGRAWIAAEAKPTSSPGGIPVPTNVFSLATEDCGDHDGDFVRCRLLFRRGRAAPVQIEQDVTGWVFVTPDARYIITEPLYVLDVREWKQYALFEALQIPNYTEIRAISRDGKRLLISRRDCASCRKAALEYYELTLP